jgi:hypothetical protein
MWYRANASRPTSSLKSNCSILSPGPRETFSVGTGKFSNQRGTAQGVGRLWRYQEASTLLGKALALSPRGRGKTGTLPRIPTNS